MERIVYRKTLDVHKNGIQFTLQGFETADNMARRIEISLMASGDTIDLPLEQLIALMYVTTPNATEPSINECTIKDNTIIYDVLPIVEEGITEMQLKLIDTGIEGAKGVLAAPRFAVEVLESNANDDNATQTTTYTALENALARAKGVYDSRLTRIEIDTDCTFRAYFADGTVYETDALHEALYKGEALMAQSYARGDSGIREGEETDNSMYYSNVSKSASIQAVDASEKSEELLAETRKHGVYTAFSVDFETGEIKYISPQYKFDVNEETGELDVIGEAYSPDETINTLVTEWLTIKSADIDSAIDEENEARKNADTELGTAIDEVKTTADNNKNVLDELTDNTVNLPNYTISLDDTEITFNGDDCRYLKLGGFAYLYFSAMFVYAENSTKVKANIIIDETSGDLVPSFQMSATNYFPITIMHNTTTGSGNYIASHYECSEVAISSSDGKPRLFFNIPRPDGIEATSVTINAIFPITE